MPSFFGIPYLAASSEKYFTFNTLSLNTMCYCDVAKKSLQPKLIFIYSAIHLLKYIKIRDCVRKQSLKWSFVSPYAIEMAYYSFSCSFFNILHVLRDLSFFISLYKTNLCIVLISILFYSIISKRKRKTENGKLERSANGY